MKLLISLVVGLLALFATYEASAMEEMGGGYSCNTVEVWSGGSQIGSTYYFDCIYTGGGGGGGGYDSGGGYGDGGGGGYEPTYCEILSINKPTGCDSDLGLPSGPDFGQGQYAAGSGLAKLIYLRNTGMPLPGTIERITNALATHTQQGASLTTSRNVYDAQFLVSLKDACEYQAANALPGAYGTSKCFTALGILASENGDGGFVSWVESYTQVNHIDYEFGGIALQNLIAQFAPGNSLNQKAGLVTAAATCASWWNSIHANGCQ